MRIALFTKQIKELKTDCLIYSCYEENIEELEIFNEQTNGLIAHILHNKEFIGKINQIYSLRLNGNIKRLILLGLGKRTEFTTKKAREAIAKAVTYARDQDIKELSVHVFNDLHPQESANLIVEASRLSLYNFNHYKTQNKNEQKEITAFTLVADQNNFIEVDKGIRNALILTEAVNIARDLGNHPGNIATPSYIAKKAKELALKTGIKCTILGNRDLERWGMNAILAVNKGSAHQAKLVILEYSGNRKGKTICLVGKGITFDSGGISIKPSDKMDEMKYDMCGGATVIGTLYAAAQLKLPHKIIGIIPLTENMPSGNAYKPGDIIKAYNGKMIDVIDTDAEGRVVLSDALAYTKNYKPEIVIDYATLTGACVVALGEECSGLFTQDDQLAKQLTESGEKTGERLWRLPLWEEYKELIKSSHADVKNYGGRYGGAITAAAFLQEFVECKKWAHLDIAGTAWVTKNKGINPVGATGVGIRMTIEFLKNWK